MTYEASTSLSVFLFNNVSSQKNVAIANLVNAIRNGLSFNENSIILAVSPSSNLHFTTQALSHDDIRERRGIFVEGDVFAAQRTPLDLSMWKLGGAAVALGLVKYANVIRIVQYHGAKLTLCSKDFP